jgi:hypothetical protein
MNVISETAVERLKLKSEKHPSPYRISWVNEKNLVSVKHRCLVQFSLGQEYVDEAWCDIIPITVCHMLLGRPWLYDRKVSYNGYINTYSFQYNGKKLVLLPLPISDFETTIPKIPAATAPKDEIAAIIDHQFVSTRRRGYYKFLVHWKHRSISDSTWIKGTALQQLHPELFIAYINHNLPESSSSREPANDAIQEAEEEEA